MKAASVWFALHSATYGTMALFGSGPHIAWVAAIAAVWGILAIVTFRA